MAIKYTEEQEKELYDVYSDQQSAEAKDLAVEQLAIKFNKPKRSIIAKLSKMGIYVSKVRQSKVTGNKPETKEQIVTKIEKRFGVLESEFMGLEKAPKLVLVKLLNNHVIDLNAKQETRRYHSDESGM